MSCMFKGVICDKPFGDYYILGKEIGRGAFASVYKCQQKGTSNFWSVKVLDKKKYRKLAATEIGILLKLKHPNVVRLKEVFESAEEVHMVLELVTGGELFERIITRGHYSEKDAACAVKDMVTAVAY
ncbi:hypothetical protein SNE40_014040 [Patella caerulea]|uniref:Protein kinase domain-containing protein n=1 Tax=Patella caerulea TaxID=87958 RepID=A0AAN8JJF6_PATCE